MISRNSRTFILLGAGMCLGLLVPMFFQNLSSSNSEVCRTKKNVKAAGKYATSRENKNVLSQKQMIFVGVMTAEKFLDTRAKAVYETWGRDLPGKSISFFIPRSHHAKINT